MKYAKFMTWLWQEWPIAPRSTFDRLRHTLDIYDSPYLDSPPKDKDLVLVATGSMYQDQDGGLVRTGITWGDLRRIRAFLDAEVWERQRKPFAYLLEDRMRPLTKVDAEEARLR